MNKIDLYDAQKLIEAKRILSEINDYNYVPSSPLTKKLETVIKKIDKILDTELEPELQKKWDLLGTL